MKTPKTMIEAIAMFADEQKAHDYFVAMRWPNGVAWRRKTSGSTAGRRRTASGSNPS